MHLSNHHGVIYESNGYDPRYDIHCSCSKPSRNNLTTYERNSDSNFVVVAKKDFLLAITTSATAETYDSAFDNI